MDINARQIDALDFNYLDQSETYQYSVDQLARAKACQPLMDKVGNEINAWEAATQAFDQAYRKASTSAQTKSLQTLDSERDSYYNGFTGTVSNAVKSPVQAQREAAQQLLEPIKRYGVNTSGEYQQQTMRLSQICQDLLENFSTQLAALGLTAWVEALQAKNLEFQQAMTARTNDQAGYVKSELTVLRNNLIAAYRNFVKLANVVFIYEGDTAYATTIDQMNAEVRHYKQIIARKGGSTSDGGDTPTPTPDGGGSGSGSEQGGGSGEGSGSGSGEGGGEQGGGEQGGSGSDQGGGVGTITPGGDSGGSGSGEGGDQGGSGSGGSGSGDSGSGDSGGSGDDGGGMQFDEG